MNMPTVKRVLKLEPMPKLKEVTDANVLQMDNEIYESDVKSVQKEERMNAKGKKELASANKLGFKKKNRYNNKSGLFRRFYKQITVVGVSLVSIIISGICLAVAYIPENMAFAEESTDEISEMITENLDSAENVPEEYPENIADIEETESIGSYIGAGAQTATESVSKAVYELSGADNIGMPDNNEAIQENPQLPNSSVNESCICTETCVENDINILCPVCVADYEMCEHVDSDISIKIKGPSDWRTKSAKIKIEVSDNNNSNDFQIKSVEAKAGQGGSYTNITKDMYIELEENCTLYVQVTDKKGNVFTASKKIKCFDTDDPTLDAEVQGELLYIFADDETSGAASVYINGSKFPVSDDGSLSINLKDYENDYQTITLQAYDKAGNRSDLKRVRNPYYVDKEKVQSQTDMSLSNPVNLQPSAPTDAKATVTSYTDKDGNSYDHLGLDETGKTPAEGGKEFYTVTTKTGKVFYLVIDKDSTTDNVFFLTEVNSNDLLNFVNYEGNEVAQGNVPLYSVDPKEEPAEEQDLDDEEISIFAKKNEKTEKAESINQGNMDESDTEETVSENIKKNTTQRPPVIPILLIAAGVGLVIFFIKKKSRSNPYEEHEEMDDDELVFVTKEDEIKQEEFD